jgi:nucleoside-diphosphate-sugar epimerase
MGLAPVVRPGRVLITGAGGFIGRALAVQCLKDGWAVRGSLRSPASERRLPAGVEPALVAELSSETDWSDALKEVDAVVHLAARVHRLKEGGGDPRSEYHRANAEGTARLAQAAADAGVSRFILMSTVKVLGEGRESAYTENDIENPQDPYAASKWAAEQALREVEARKGIASVILRPPLVYGPEVKANFFRLVRMVELGLPLPFAGMANRRSMLFVGNLVHAIGVCLRRPEAAGNTYLVADAESLSTPDLVREIGVRLSGSPPRLFFLPQTVMTAIGVLMGKKTELSRLTDSLIVDASKIRRELGWRPVFSILDGLGITLEWYRDRRLN